MTDSRYLKRTIVKEEIESRYLGEKRTLRIYLPQATMNCLVILSYIVRTAKNFLTLDESLQQRTALSLTRALNLSLSLAFRLTYLLGHRNTLPSEIGLRLILLASLKRLFPM